MVAANMSCSGLLKHVSQFLTRTLARLTKDKQKVSRHTKGSNPEHIDSDERADFAFQEILPAKREIQPNPP